MTVKKKLAETYFGQHQFLPDATPMNGLSLLFNSDKDGRLPGITGEYILLDF